MGRMYPSESEFDVSEHQVVHRPTNASWSVSAGQSQMTYFKGMLGSVLPNGDDYREDEVQQMGLRLFAGRSGT